MSEILNLQTEKRAFVDTLEVYQKIKNPTLFHKLAFRYDLDQYINRASRFLQAVLEAQDEIGREITKQGLGFKESVPQIILDRIEEVQEAYRAENPRITPEELNKITGLLFDEGGELEGLYTPEGTINKEWLTEYLSYDDNMPENLTIPFTEEMQADIALIYAQADLSDTDKQDMTSELFAVGGKYDGYVQPDGTVDATKIIVKVEATTSNNESEISSL